MSDVEFKLLANAATQSFEAGESIFLEGDPASELFVIKSGTVEIRLGERVIETLSHNKMFGELGLIDHSPRSATAVAKTDVELVPIDEKQFLFLVQQTPFFALNIMRVLAARLRAANRQS